MDKFDKLKIASSSIGERLKTGGAQMSRALSTKVKDLLAGPTPESKLVDDATLETMPEPNWGLNLRICSMINNEEINGAEIVKAIKKKMVGKNVISQRLCLDLLEACTSNCDKVSSEVASEKLLDDMVKMIEDTKTDHGNRVRALQLIRAWGESEELAYLPVFRQTYENLKTRELHIEAPSNMESYFDQQPLSPPERYPIPDMGFQDAEPTSYVSYRLQSVEEKKEFLVVTRNSLEILSSILNSEAEPKPVKEDLTMSMYEKCKQSLLVIQRIIQTTSDDEVMLFDALNLHDELQQVTSRYEEMVAALEPQVAEKSAAAGQQDGSQAHEAKSSLLVENSGNEAKLSSQVENHSKTETADLLKDERTESSSETKDTGSTMKESHQ